jgi:hypothetical protein
VIFHGVNETGLGPDVAYFSNFLKVNEIRLEEAQDLGDGRLFVVDFKRGDLSAN